MIVEVNITSPRRNKSKALSNIVALRERIERCGLRVEPLSSHSELPNYRFAVPNCSKYSTQQICRILESSRIEVIDCEAVENGKECPSPRPMSFGEGSTLSSTQRIYTSIPVLNQLI